MDLAHVLTTPPAPTGKLVEAMAVARAKFEDIKKNRENPHLKSRYANLVAIIDATAECLAEQGVIVTQEPDVTASGANVLRTVLRHKSGEFVSSTLPLAAAPGDAQKFGSCLTYMRRYGLAAILNVSADEDDDDGHGATQGARAPARPAPEAPAASPFIIVEKGAPKDYGNAAAFVARWEKMLAGVTDEKRGAFATMAKANGQHLVAARDADNAAIGDLLDRIRAAMPT